MPTLNDLIDGDVQQLDTGFTFTEGPLYHPNGFYYFIDVRESKFYRIKPGEKAELLRENTGEGNGTTFDPQGRLIQCEGGNRRVTRWPADGMFASSDVLMDSSMASACHGRTMSSANPTELYFTNPGLPFRSASASSICRRSTGSCPTAATSTSPISNTRTGSPSRPRACAVCRQYAAGSLHPPHRARQRRQHGSPQHLRRHVVGREDRRAGRDEGRYAGNVYCTGPGGTWVYAADGTHIGTIKTPEVPANLAFGGPDMKTLFFTAHTSVYSMRVKVAGLPGHPFKKG